MSATQPIQSSYHNVFGLPYPFTNRLNAVCSSNKPDDLVCRGTARPNARYLALVVNEGPKHNYNKTSL